MDANCNAHPGEDDIEQHQLRLETVAGGAENCLRITNLGDCPIHLADRCMGPGEVVETVMPVRVSWEQNHLVAFVPIDDRKLFQGCSSTATELPPAIASGAKSNILAKHGTQPLVTPQASICHSPSPETLTRWFQALAGIQRQAACTQEFYREAVRAMIDPGGLDAGMLLERENGQWRIKYSHVEDPPTGTGFEPFFADLAFRRRETLVYCASGADSSNSEPSKAALFAAPVFNENMEVVAVLYGSRQAGNSNRRHRIRDLEALWIQLLAEAVTSGFVRLKHESEATRQRVLLEQVFPAEVVRRLSRQSTFELPAEDREITLMFADLIDSSSICENQPPELICHFLSDVMDTMTSVVHRHGGVIVDYFGDGLIAMWNAPLDQPDHATLACQSGLAILRKLTFLNSVWQFRLERAIQFGIGVHTGNAIVGNSGSRKRLKYGPRGFSVNLASRIEKATRRLNQPLLISDATRQQLPPDISAYRLGRFKLWGIELPTVLHALHSLETNNAVNPCCVSKHHEVVRLIKEENYAGAASQLDSCHGCALDELSLKFMQGELESLSDECGGPGFANAITGEPVFDLTK